MAIFSALGSVMGGAAASSGAKQGAAYAKEMFGKVEDAVTPWIDAGHASVEDMRSVLSTDGVTADLDPYMKMGMDRLTSDVNAYDPNAIGETYEQSPGYDWLVKQGQAATDASASARGGLLSGATLKAASEYQQGVAQQDYWNYVNQVQQGQQLEEQSRQQQFSNIFGVSGQGLQASGTLASAATGTANTVANAYTAAGQAMGKGISGAFGSIGKFLNPFG